MAGLVFTVLLCRALPSVGLQISASGSIAHCGLAKNIDPINSETLTKCAIFLSLFPQNQGETILVI